MPASERPPAPERIPAAERREQILAAASRVFGEHGYAGATTDQVAQAAGISQPYVVRMFGSKENLFLEVLQRALHRLLDAFRVTLADGADEDAATLGQRLGEAYADLITDRGILLSLMQAFLLGNDPAIGAAARSGMLEVYRLLREEAGLSAESTVDFLAHGMLFNTLVAMRMPDDLERGDAAATELLQCSFRSKLDLVLGAMSRGAE